MDSRPKMTNLQRDFVKSTVDPRPKAKDDKFAKRICKNNCGLVGKAR